MNTPDPDPGEEYQHVNTQLFGIIDPPGNRNAMFEEMAAPFNAPQPGQVPTMDGFVADYQSPEWVASPDECQFIRSRLSEPPVVDDKSCRFNRSMQHHLI